MQDNETSQLDFLAPIPREGDAIPTAFQVFPFGTVEIEGGEPFLVDSASMDAVVERFNARGLDMVIDYEHQTEEGTEAPAAGWIKRLENRGEEGLWAVAEWSGRAREYLAKKEYRYFSPVFLLAREDRKLQELLRVALTNAPRLNRIRPIVAKAGLHADGVAPAESAGEAVGRAGPPDEAGTGEAVSAAAKLARSDDTVACKEVIEALGLPAGAGKSEVVATAHALRMKPDLSAQVAALRRELAGRERDGLVAAALEAGKITPAQREWAEQYAMADAEGFRTFVAKAPQLIPLGTIGPASGTRDGRCAPDAGQDRINRLLGVSEAAWKKYNLQS